MAPHPRPHHRPTARSTTTHSSSWIPVALALLAAAAIPGLVLWLLRHGEWWRRRRVGGGGARQANKRRTD